MSLAYSNKEWLNSRKISDLILQKFKITYEENIHIPIYNENGDFVFYKHRRNPLTESFGAKYWYDKGSQACLFGANHIKKEKTVVICEGELDALVLWSHNIPAVSSTGGAMTFMSHWLELLTDKEVYICFDNDATGVKGAVRLLNLIPRAKVILLPNITGLKDITDYYRIIGDIRGLMQHAKHYDTYTTVIDDMNDKRAHAQSDEFHKAWIAQWEEDNMVVDVVKPKLPLAEADTQLMQAKTIPIQSIIKVSRQNKAICPFHKEKTPSMVIYPDNKFHCFGCGKHGDVIDIVMEAKNLNFKEAVQFLLC